MVRAKATGVLPARRSENHSGIDASGARQDEESGTADNEGAGEGDDDRGQV